MKTFLPHRQAVITALLLGMGLMLNSVQAQETTAKQRHADMAQRRAEFLANNPEAAARMAERQQEREAFLAANPDAGERFGNRRHQEGFGRRGEHAGEGEGKPHRRREAGEEGVEAATKDHLQDVVPASGPDRVRVAMYRIDPRCPETCLSARHTGKAPGSAWPDPVPMPPR